LTLSLFGRGSHGRKTPARGFRFRQRRSGCRVNRLLRLTAKPATTLADAVSLACTKLGANGSVLVSQHEKVHRDFSD